MQRTITIFLLICLHSQPICNTYTVADFFFNLDYIKEFLCINKDKPKLQCNGKCHLMQQLKKNDPLEDNENQIPEFKITKTEYVDFSNIMDNSSTKRLYILKKQLSSYLLGSYAEINWEVFHPPRV